MTGGGRPLRFLALVTIVWVGGRGVMLWPGGSPITAAGHAVLPPAAAKDGADGRADGWTVSAWRLPAVSWPPHASPHWLAQRPLPRHEPVIGTAATMTVDAAHDAASGVIGRSPGIIPGLPVPGPPHGLRRSRIFGSAWLFVRPGGGPARGLPGVQLGGSQAGVRVAYALRDDRRLALAARLSSPLGPGMRELALGVEWQPTRLPLRLVAEQRFALNTGSGGPTLGLVGGAGPVPVGAGFELEAYGQAGIIGRAGGEGFADGAVRVAHPVVASGGVRIDLGAGGWGAVQKGAARLDLGPSLSARATIGGQPVRLSLDWRQRVAGDARPGSGLVLALGADF